jgi:hypothetical protein
MVIVQQLRKRLPPGYVAGPRVHRGAQVEVYEVQVFDLARGRRLVAAIEIVSPANQDRPEHRNLFVATCAALLQQEVAVIIVDLVTVRRFNLFVDLLTLFGNADPSLGEPPSLYAVACRCVQRGQRTMLEAWFHPLALGQPLPTLPLWLSDERSVALDLEPTYEQACNDLWLT